MKYKKMREYTHEEFVELVKDLNEEELLNLSANYGGYPVLFRMSLDERICHIPFIQTGSSVIIRNEKGQILLQERTDRNQWCLPGGCQDLGENLKDTAVREVEEETGIKLNKNEIILIDTLSGKLRRNSYPNGDIVYNNSSLYFSTCSQEPINTAYTSCFVTCTNSLALPINSNTTGWILSCSLSTNTAIPFHSALLIEGFASSSTYVIAPAGPFLAHNLHNLQALLISNFPSLYSIAEKGQIFTKVSATSFVILS